MGVAVPLGGAWLHGYQSHPLASDVSHVAWPNWQPVNTFLVDHGQISNACVERVSALLARLESHWNTQTGLSLSLAEARQRSAEENALQAEQRSPEEHIPS